MKKISLFLLIALLAMPFSMKADYNVSSTATWKTIKIVLDPGHGGSDSGASGPSAPHEATLCLAAAKQVRTWLYALGASSSNVKMTRTTDVYVGLSARKNYTSTYNSDIFSSFHLNAFNGTAKGTETYYTNKSGATSSSKLASRVQSQLIAKLGLTNRGVKTANYTVIGNGVTYPSILTEGLFVDNRSEWNIIKDYKTPSNGFLNWCRAHIIGYYNYLKNDKGCTKFTNPTTVTGTASGGSSSGGSTTPDTPSTPSASLTATASGSTTLTGKMKMSNPPSFTIKVVGSGLSNEISYNPSNSAVKVKANSGWNTTTGGTLTVTLNPDYSQGAGTYEGYVAIQSTSSYRKEVAFKVTLAEADGSANVDQGDKSEGGVQGQNVTVTNDNKTFTLTYPYMPHLDGVIGTAAKANSRAANSSFEIKVEANITDIMTVNSSSSCVVLTKASGWDDQKGGTIVVTPNPAFVLGAGEYSATIAFQQSSANRATVECTVTLAPDGTFTADVDKIVLPELELGGEDTKALGTITYLGGGLAEDIAVSISGEGFYINATNADGSDNLVTSTTVPAKGGTIEIAYVATTAGEFSTNLVAKSGATTITTPVSVLVHAAGQKPVLNDDVTSLTGVWEYSQAKNNVASAPWLDLTSARTSDMVKSGDKLYVLNGHAWSAVAINIVDAYTGALKSAMSMKDIYTGAITDAASLALLDGKLVMANCARMNGTDKFCVYKWDSDTSDPVEILNVLPVIETSMMAVTGDWSDGRLWFTDGLADIYYSITNGVVDTTPVTVTTLAEDAHVISRCGAELIPYEDGTFWMDGRDIVPTLFNKDASVRYAIKSSALGKYGTASSIVTFGAKTYMVSTDYLGDRDKGYAAVIDITEGPDKVARKCIYPEAGLGTGISDKTTLAYMNSVITEVVENADGAVLNIWVLIQQEGIAHAQFKGEYVATGIEDVEVEEVVDENAPVEYYNLQGVRVEGEYLNPGIYIRRQGNSVSKVLVK